MSTRNQYGQFGPTDDGPECAYGEPTSQAEVQKLIAGCCHIHHPTLGSDPQFESVPFENCAWCNKVLNLLADMESAIRAAVSVSSPPAQDGPIRLSEGQENAVKSWAADDRLWTTQETVEFNLRTFARFILILTDKSALPSPPVSGGPTAERHLEYLSAALRESLNLPKDAPDEDIIDYANEHADFRRFPKHPLMKGQCRDRHHASQQRCELQAGHNEMHDTGDYRWPQLAEARPQEKA